MKLKFTTALVGATLIGLTPLAAFADGKDDDKKEIAIEIKQLNTDTITSDLTVLIDGALSGKKDDDRNDDGRNRGGSGSQDVSETVMDALDAAAVAIGNSVSLEGVTAAGELAKNSGDRDFSERGNKTPVVIPGAIEIEQTATDDITASLDVEVKDIKIDDALGGIDLSSTAIGNTASLGTDTASISAGELDLEQVFKGEKITATADVEFDNVASELTTLTTAAIGNSANVVAEVGYKTDVDQTIGGERGEGAEISAILDFITDADVKRIGTPSVLDASSVAIGNTFSAELFEGFAADLSQTVSSASKGGDYDDHDKRHGHDNDKLSAQISSIATVETGSYADVTVSSTAIGNAASFTGVDGGVGQAAKIEQDNYASVLAQADVKSFKPTTFSSTAAAIGNTATISISFVE
ncbi:hypothetical protein [Celeribacter marinus]|uniref:hypothetical protein n=1 Tax=Celeribacter marinus TaxID=1397108 RepID=UPI00316F007F